MRVTIFNPLILTSLLLASPAAVQAATVITVVTDIQPGETTTNVASATVGTVNSPIGLPSRTYTVSGLDLTSFGGGVGQSIAFNVAFAHGGSGGSGVRVNGFGNISVTGGDNNQVDNLETITMTVSLNTGSSTFSGDFADLSVGFTGFTTGGVSGGADEFWDLTTASGTQSFQSPTNSATFASSSFLTLDPVAGATLNGTFNVQAFGVTISAIPEPSAALLGGLGLLALLRRRR